MLNKVIRASMTFLLILGMTMMDVHAEGGMLTLNVHVEGLDPGVETWISVEKEEDGIITQYQSQSINHVASVTLPFGGSCTIISGDVSGYITAPPLSFSLSRIKGKFTIDKTVTYTKASIPISSVDIIPNDAILIIGQTLLLTVDIDPDNASNPTVLWSSSDTSVASVTNGLVQAHKSGVVNVIVHSVENNSLFDSSSITVGTITDFTRPEVKDVQVGTLILLPDTITTQVTLPDTSIIERGVSVTWLGIGSSNTVVYNQAGDYTLTGDLAYSDMTATLHIHVEGSPITMATDVIFENHTLSVYESQTVNLNFLEIIPTGSDTSAILWESTAPAIANIASYNELGAVVSGITSGTATINAYIEQNGQKVVLDSAIVNIAIDPTITDPTYIIATELNSLEGADQFESKFDVYIRGYGLTPNETYYILVEDKGNGEALGIGQIHTDGSEIVFNLYEFAPFNDTDNFSVGYFIKMSKDSSFPTGDDEFGIPRTLIDNFKISSPVPTGYIVVNVIEWVNGSYPGTISPDLWGNDVILGRELDEPAIETQYEDYLNSPSAIPSLPLYTDEIKMIGHLNPDGSVSWETPKERLKIGGYILLIELSNGYESNLDEVYGSDGTLLKEVHITRNKTVYRTIELIKP